MTENAKGVDSANLSLNLTSVPHQSYFLMCMTIASALHVLRNCYTDQMRKYIMRKYIICESPC